MSESQTLTFAPAPPAPQARTSSFPWVNLLLFGATLLSTMFVGTVLGYLGLFGDYLPPLIAGFLFSATLLLTLGAHELGHYFVARINGVDASLPYFIPAPLGLGTFGAFIRMRSPVANRHALFDVGLAGPVAGLAVALPLFVVGLFLAPVQFQHPLFGDGLLVTGLIGLVETVRAVPSGHHLMLHPISFAAYVSLFITAINLLPAGQLDGGHVAYALFGKRSFMLGLLSFAFLLFMGWFTEEYSWYIWAGLIAIFGLRHPPTLNDAEPVGGIRWLLGAGAFLALILLFASDPFPMFG